MGDWDDEETVQLVKPVQSAWIDDNNTDVPDAWDVEEKPAIAEPENNTEPAKKISSKKKKKKMKQEMELKMVAELQKHDEEASKILTELERQHIAEEAEFELIADSFGKEESNVALKVQDGLDFGEPQTKEEFCTLANKLIAKFKSLEVSAHYSKFVEEIFHQIVLEVDLDTLRDMSVSIGALITEKQKLVKVKSKKKAGKSTKLLLERDNDYGYDMDHEQDDFDDFI